MKVRRGAMAVLAVGTLGLGAIGMMSPVSAGETWPGEVTVSAACVDGDGVVLVDIFDDFGAGYNVFLFLGEQLDPVESALGVDEGVTDFGPLVDGTYTVVVDWINEEIQVFEGDVTVDCVPDDTTTTTAAPSSSTTTAAPAAAAAAAATPRFTG
ncbi:hypothetical protein [Rhabdothermincola salaria]|uniref:hypothetical protein n=1 Tax=Rhabdothermincola salaria TaxID=2903142 RepID=UPI001E29765F|nr:hypothetical protein [Rhabdothermincola salaria]MCD9622873.1 hypothetical protein [Rhabdothermincola salaria]